VAPRPGPDLHDAREHDQGESAARRRPARNAGVHGPDDRGQVPADPGPERELSRITPLRSTA